MDVITMPKIKSLVKKLRDTYPQFVFKEAESFSWSPRKNTIFYSLNGDCSYLLHELAHALLGHVDYEYDIELIPMERDAWNVAAELSAGFGVQIDEDLIESNLDSYRDWMHSRSTCPHCSANGLQIKKRAYKCPACSQSWRVNDARICGLKRYKIQPKN